MGCRLCQNSDVWPDIHIMTVICISEPIAFSIEHAQCNVCPCVGPKISEREQKSADLQQIIINAVEQAIKNR